MPDISNTYKRFSKKYTLVDVSTVIGASATTRITATVGLGFKGGNYHARSILAVAGGNVAGIAGNLRSASASSDPASSMLAILNYSSVYNTAVDTYLSPGIFDNAGGNIALANAYYQASTGKVNFTFTNVTASNKTLSVRIEGYVWG